MGIIKENEVLGTYFFKKKRGKVIFEEIVNDLYGCCCYLIEGPAK